MIHTKLKINKLLLSEIVGLKNKNKNKSLNALENGVFLTRDLVSEPGNILHPDEYAKRLTKIKKYRIKSYRV